MAASGDFAEIPYPSLGRDVIRPAAAPDIGRPTETGPWEGPLPPQWREHWHEHTQQLSLVGHNDTVAVYFDPDVIFNAVTWLLPYLTRMWQYVLDTYGSHTNLLGAGRLYSIHHEGRYDGGHPATVYDASHDFRNVSDVGGDNWTVRQYEVVTHESGHIVEAVASGRHGSPAFPLWGDSKWMEFYIYDIYTVLGMSDEARRFNNQMLRQSDPFPVAGTHWFRDWFHPLWSDHGAAVMVRFFALLGRYFPATDNGQDFARDLNWGEFVHFMSGAAGEDLRPLASRAFDWPRQWRDQHRQATQAFPHIQYD